ncbi:Hypothetical protein PHPALM_15516 [Phytophthora palmivora]|uniref:Reverse transcriptase n=1 Tax=Phytophthora palmivora TaxID=4796 RepID=A0A2P4XS09_9STRA|nr:Hypothetical protein PHPALM_15516 [Phytophthora palmivora]
MAALRYSAGSTRSDRRQEGEQSWRRTYKQIDYAATNEVATEEGGVLNGQVLTTEEDGELTDKSIQSVSANTTVHSTTTDDKYDADTATTELGAELTDELVSKLGSIARVRRVARRSRREAKRERAQRAADRAATAVVGSNDEVDRAVEELAASQHDKRQHHAQVAREALQARRQQRSHEVTHASKCAQVSLVQRRNTVEATDVSTGNYVEAGDGLPTAVMEVDEFVEGIGGFLLEVMGVWTFSMTNIFGQLMQVTACIIDGCADEFLIGVDFMKKHQAKIDFEANEVCCIAEGQRIVIPFRTQDNDGEVKVATVRLVSHTRLRRRAVQPVEVSVMAPDGEEGVFLPTDNCGPVLLAAAVTTVANGRALIPAINMHGGRVKLPSKMELGTWIPLNADMQTLKVHGELKYERLKAWLEEMSDDQCPLNNEDEVRIGITDPNARELVIKLLRAYRKLADTQSDCPPATTLNVEHHIDTGTATPIMMKRRRMAQTEDSTVDKNVDSMLQSGVIEESDGAWGFPVVLVKKKDGEVRFCIDYRALNGMSIRFHGWTKH